LRLPPELLPSWTRSTQRKLQSQQVQMSLYFVFVFSSRHLSPPGDCFRKFDCLAKALWNLRGPIRLAELEHDLGSDAGDCVRSSWCSAIPDPSNRKHFCILKTAIENKQVSGLYPLTCGDCEVIL
jgi:hypothetical protein